MPKTQTYTIAGTARALGCGLSYAYGLVYSGKLQAEKIDGQWRIPADSVEALIAKRTGQARAQ